MLICRRWSAACASHVEKSNHTGNDRNAANRLTGTNQRTRAKVTVSPRPLCKHEVEESEPIQRVRDYTCEGPRSQAAGVDMLCSDTKGTLIQNIMTVELKPPWCETFEQELLLFADLTNSVAHQQSRILASFCNQLKNIHVIKVFRVFCGQSSDCR